MNRIASAGRQRADRHRADRHGADWHRAAFEHAPVGVAVCSLDGRFLDVNAAWRGVLAGTGVDAVDGRLDDLTGFVRRCGESREDLGEDWTDLLEQVRHGLRDVVSVEIPLAGPLAIAPPPDAPGTEYPARLRWARVTAVRMDEVLLCHLEDVTTRRRESERVARLALTDALTGLANRRLAAQRLDDALTRTAGSTRSVGVLYLDLDGFKQVNDTLGHDVGDQLLVGVARRLASVIRAEDTAGRVGGDEFVVVAADLRGPHDLDELAARVESAFDEPITLGDRTVLIRASVGRVLSRPGDSGEELVARADAAMFAAKRHHRRIPRRPVPAADPLQLTLLGELAAMDADR